MHALDGCWLCRLLADTPDARLRGAVSVAQAVVSSRQRVLHHVVRELLDLRGRGWGWGTGHVSACLV